MGIEKQRKAMAFEPSLFAALGQIVPKYQPVMKPRRAKLRLCSLSTSHSAMAGMP